MLVEAVVTGYEFVVLNTKEMDLFSLNQRVILVNVLYFLYGKILL